MVFELLLSMGVTVPLDQECSAPWQSVIQPAGLPRSLEMWRQGSGDITSRLPNSWNSWDPWALHAVLGTWSQSMGTDGVTLGPKAQPHHMRVGGSGARPQGSILVLRAGREWLLGPEVQSSCTRLSPASGPVHATHLAHGVKHHYHRPF